MKKQLFVLVFAAALSTTGARAQCPPQEVAGLTAPGNQPWEYFGATVATSGDTTLVGCGGYGSPSPQTAGPGAVFVYTRDPLDAHHWTLTHTIPAPAGQNSFGWAVALNGDTAAIACGALTYPWSYVVRVYERDAGGANQWGFVAELHNDYYPFGNADHFGRGLAVDGDRIAVGAPYYGGPTTSSGSVYVFERDAGGPKNWGKVARIVRPGPPTFSISDFGGSLSLDGDALLIGDERSGWAGLYERNAGGAGQWGATHSFFESAPFPYSWEDVLAVALHGDTVMLGWQFSSQTATAWLVRVHERDLGGPGNWGALQTLTPTGGSSFTRFGRDIELDDERAVVGASSDIGWPSRGGAVYVFEKLGVWQQTHHLTASDSMNADQFGIDVELDGNQLVVGNLRNGTGSYHLGEVHVFDLESPQPPVSYCTAGTSSNGCSATLHGVGAPSASNADGFELVAVGLDGRRSAAIFYGISGPVAIPVPGTASWRCVHAPLQRLGIVDSGGTAGACDGSASVDWNAFRATHPAALGAPFIAGQTVWAQAWNRDALTPTGLPATQGLSFTLCP